MSGRYLIRPKAGADLDHQALYLAEKAAPEIGHRFLIAKHLLCLHRSREWGGILELPRSKLEAEILVKRRSQVVDYLGFPFFQGPSLVGLFQKGGGTCWSKFYVLSGVGNVVDKHCGVYRG